MKWYWYKAHGNYRYFGLLELGDFIAIAFALKANRRVWCLGLTRCRAYIGGLVHWANEPTNDGLALLHVSFGERNDPREHGRALLSISKAGICIGFIWLYKNLARWQAQQEAGDGR